MWILFSNLSLMQSLFNDRLREPNTITHTKHTHTHTDTRKDTDTHTNKERHISQFCTGMTSFLGVRFNLFDFHCVNSSSELWNALSQTFCFELKHFAGWQQFSRVRLIRRWTFRVIVITTSKHYNAKWHLVHNWITNNGIRSADPVAPIQGTKTAC